MDLYVASERSTGSRLANWWLYQEGLDLEGIRTASQEAEWK